MVSSALVEGGHIESSCRQRRVSDIPRLVAWRRQLLQAHERLRLALSTAQRAARDGADVQTPREISCSTATASVSLSTAITGEKTRCCSPPSSSSTPQRHVWSASPARPRQDRLPSDRIRQRSAVRRMPASLAHHLEGLAAIMESHFRFEERELEPLLDQLELDADPAVVFGPL